MTLENVRCRVSNCKYWKNENCHAKGIEVSLDSGVQKAHKAQYTQCRTFEESK